MKPRHETTSTAERSVLGDRLNSWLCLQEAVIYLKDELHQGGA